MSGGQGSAWDLAGMKQCLGTAALGEALHDLIAELYPLCRSVTGQGVRETLRILAKHVPLSVHEIATGTPVFDWTIPKEWNIRDAYVKNARGERVIDFRRSNLHVVGYSIPVHRIMTLADLKEHLFTLPEHPDWVPFRTSPYREGWGFCLSHRQLQDLEDVEYEVCIDSSLEEGGLSYGEYVLKGDSDEEVLLSCHICHPSLCNDNLSGIGVVTFLARFLGQRAHRYTYRFLFLPVTIGAIAWLSRNEERLGRIRHGMVLTLLGDTGHSTYKKSRRGDAEIDRAAALVLRESGEPFEVIDFLPYGYDERQFCSPGFDLPVGCLMRSRHGRFPEYHTSADDLDFVKPACLEDSLAKCLAILNVLENDRVFVNLNPKGEPQLGRRGLYRAIAEQTDGGIEEMALLWTLNLSDGRHSLMDIAERSGCQFPALQRAAVALLAQGLLKQKDDGHTRCL